MENSSLRKEMKVMNSALNALIEQVKDEKQRNKEAPKVKELDHGQMVSAKNKQAATYEKSLVGLEAEYDTLKKRLDLLQNPLYAVDLQEKIDDLVVHVSSLRKKRKIMEDNQKRNNKAMDRFLVGSSSRGYGTEYKYKQLQRAQEEYKVILTQINSVNRDIKYQKEQREDTKAQTQAILDKIQFVEAEAKALEIDFDGLMTEEANKLNVIKFNSEKDRLTHRLEVCKKALKVYHKTMKTECKQVMKKNHDMKQYKEKMRVEML